MQMLAGAWKECSSEPNEETATDKVCPYSVDIGIRCSGSSLIVTEELLWFSKLRTHSRPTSQLEDKRHQRAENSYSVETY